MHVEVVRGDLLDQDVDVIVNAWNRNVIPWWLLLPQGVSGAIKRRAGYAPFREVGRHGPMPLGTAVFTSAGRLPHRGIIHVAGINLLWRSSERAIRDSARNAVRLAEQHDFVTIAFPLIGAGSGGFPPEKAQAILLDELETIESTLTARVVVFEKKGRRRANGGSTARHRRTRRTEFMSAAIADDVPALAVAAAETAERTERRRSRGGCALYSAIFLLIPTLIIASICLWIYLQDRSLAEEAKKRARAAGDPLTAEEFQAAFYPASPEIDEATARWLDACDALERASISPLAKDLPDTGFLRPASPERRPALDERGLYASSTLSTLDRFFEDGGDEAVAAVHAARRAAVPPRIACDLSGEREPALPHCGLLFVSGSLLVLEAERKAARGDLAAATEALLSMVAMSDACAGDASPHGIGRRSHAHRWACLCIRGMVERIDFSDSQLAQLDKSLAHADFRGDLIRHLQAEQCRVVRAIETDEPTADPELAFFRNVPLRGADEAMAIENLQEVLDGARIDLESAQAACDRVSARTMPIEGTVDQIRYQVALWRAREADPRICLVLQAEADRRLTRTLLACERYRSKQGSWPANLEALVPEFLAEIPQDVVKGEGVSYLVEGKRLKLGSNVSENWSRAFPPAVNKGTVEVAIEKPRDASPEPTAP